MESIGVAFGVLLGIGYIALSVCFVVLVFRFLNTGRKAFKRYLDVTHAEGLRSASWYRHTGGQR